MCVRIPWHSNRILMVFHVEDNATFARGNVRFDAHWPLSSVIRTRPTKHCVSIKFLCLPSILTPIPINSCQNIGFYPRSITPPTPHRAYVHYDRTYPLLPRGIRAGKIRYYFTAAKSTFWPFQRMLQMRFIRMPSPVSVSRTWAVECPCASSSKSMQPKSARMALL